MKNKIFLIVALLVTAFTAQAQEMQYFTIKVGDFTQLSITDHINVEYRCNPDSSGYAKFISEPSMANQLIFSNNKKGKLTISVGTDSVNAENMPDIVVYSAYLQSAINQGDSTLHVRSIAPAPKLSFMLTSNGTIKLDDIVATSVNLEIFTGKGTISAVGKCTNLNAKNTGTGSINAENLLAENVNCRILGTGKVYCNVDGGDLLVKGSGTGKLFYRGKPEKTKIRQLGTIKAICLDDEKETE